MENEFSDVVFLKVDVDEAEVSWKFVCFFVLFCFSHSNMLPVSGGL